MMTDLIRRLRTNPMKNKILREAANEIERLSIIEEAAKAFEEGLSSDCDGPERDALRYALEPKP